MRNMADRSPGTQNVRALTGKQTLLFVQGAGDMWEPEGSGVLLNYLREQLGDLVDIVGPEMPDAAIGPHYDKWRDQITRELAAIDGAALVVGHSVGASVVVKCLSEKKAPTNVSALFLVSTPWWGPDGWGYDEFGLADDFEKRLPAVPTFLYQSRGDPHVPFEHLGIYERHLSDAQLRVIEGTEHSFTDGLPELVEDIRTTIRAGAA